MDQQIRTIHTKLVSTIADDDRATLLSTLGELSLHAGDQEASLESFKAAASLRTALIERGNRHVAPDLAASQQRVGDALVRLDRVSEAISAFKAEINTRERLYSTNQTYGLELLTATYRLGNYVFANKRYEYAYHLYGQALGLAIDLNVFQVEMFKTVRYGIVACTTYLCLQLVTDAFRRSPTVADNPQQLSNLLNLTITFSNLGCHIITLTYSCSDSDGDIQRLEIPAYNQRVKPLRHSIVYNFNMRREVHSRNFAYVHET